MTVAGQPISNIVRVAVTLSQTPAQGQNLNAMLILGSSSVIDVAQRMRTYTSFEGVAADFSSSDPEYLAAQLWFAQVPQPIQLNIGRWAAADTRARLVSAPRVDPASLLTTLTAIASGSFELYMIGVPVSITGLDFTTQTNLNGCAAVIQTALQAIQGAATFVWDANNEVFRLSVGGTAGTVSTVGYMLPPTATGKVTFSGQPSNLDTLTLNGTAITFVSGTPTGNQVQIGASVAATIAALEAFIDASSDTQLVKFNAVASATILYLEAATPGTGGNALTLARSGANMTLSGGTLSGGSGLDVSQILGMSASSSGAYIANGVDAEEPVDAVQILDNMFSNKWYGLSVLSADDDQLVAVAGYIEAATIKHFLGVTTQDTGTLVAGNETNIAYRLKELRTKKTAVQYSSESPYAAVSLLGRILTTNWSGNNTVITLMFKQEPLIVGESLTVSQLSAIESYNCNVFVNYNNDTTIIQNGVASSGDYVDTIIGADWLAIELQTAVYNLLYTTPTKIPQTDAGMHIIATVLDQVLSSAVNNGLLAPGVWQTTGFGIIGYGTPLPKGYYIYQPPVASQSPAQRAQRLSVPFQIAAKLAGAVHKADISVTINQ